MNPHDRAERGTRNMRLVLSCLESHTEGRTQKEISEETGIAEWEVKNAINNLSREYPVGEEEYDKSGSITTLNYFILNRHLV